MQRGAVLLGRGRPPVRPAPNRKPSGREGSRRSVRPARRRARRGARRRVPRRPRRRRRCRSRCRPRSREAHLCRPSRATGRVTRMMLFATGLAERHAPRRPARASPSRVSRSARRRRGPLPHAARAQGDRAPPRTAPRRAELGAEHVRQAGERVGVLADGRRQHRDFACQRLEHRENRNPRVRRARAPPTRR